MDEQELDGWDSFSLSVNMLQEWQVMTGRVVVSPQDLEDWLSWIDAIYPQYALDLRRAIEASE